MTLNEAIVGKPFTTTCSNASGCRSHTLNGFLVHYRHHNTKHDHFRIVPFPKSIHDKVRRQVEVAEGLHRDDAINNPNGDPVPPHMLANVPQLLSTFAGILSSWRLPVSHRGLIL